MKCVLTSRPTLVQLTDFAVAIGTLRYMGARLRGLDEGRKKGDPLRGELDNIRSKLVELKKLEAAASKEDEKSSDASAKKKDNSQQTDDNGNNKKKKRRKVLDTDASERMIKSALNESK